MEHRFFREFIQTATDCFNKGWNERNGGNMSYRMKPEEVACVESLFYKNETHDLPQAIAKIKNEYFLVTGTGRYFRNVERYPNENVGIIRINDTGSAYTIVWGLDESLPTSELPTHLLNHSKIMDDGMRAILHGHQTNLIALSFIFEQSDEELTKILWKMMTECLVVFPNGIKVIDWMVPGNFDIGHQTANNINEYDVVVWKHHGAFVKGIDLNDAFGLIETVEKACEIYMKILATQKPMVAEITDANLQELAKAFNV